MQTKTRHAQSEAVVRAEPAEVFAYLDDQTRLGAHMQKRSLMMVGGRMTYEFDAARGQTVGSVIQMGGSFLGIPLFVREVVTERSPPTRKLWETRGPQRMLVIDHYVMGFETRLVAEGTALRVFIDYQLPPGLPGRWLGQLFAPVYARWCVSRMVKDASRHFGGVAGPGVKHEAAL